MIERNHPTLSLRHQCRILNLPRGRLYYQPAQESEENLNIMRIMDEEYTDHPFYGVKRMVAILRRMGYTVNPKRVRRLLRIMGLMAIYPKKKGNYKHEKHLVYPYLLKDLIIDKVNQVWCSDITYIRLRQGFVYLVAVMDWYSRHVLSWRLSNSLDTSFCLEALEEALWNFGHPNIWNSDQGSQYTSESLTRRLLAEKVQISMASKGRAYDNIFIERLWRSVKQEEVYIHDYEDVGDARRSLEAYFRFYNEERPHQGLDYRTPYEVYTEAPIL